MPQSEESEWEAVMALAELRSFAGAQDSHNAPARRPGGGRQSAPAQAEPLPSEG